MNIRDLDSQEEQPFSKTLTLPGNVQDRRINVNVNYYPLNLNEFYKKRLYRVDVQFTPESLTDKIYRYG